MENPNNLFNSIAEAQKQAVENFANATEKMAKSLNMDLNSDFFKKWYDSQMSFFNQNAGESNMNGGMNFFNTWMQSQMDMAKEWMSSVQTNFGKMNGMNMNDDMKNNYSNMMNTYQSWMNTMTTTYSEMLKNFNNMQTKDAFSGMFNNSEMYMNMFKMWMPMMSSIQDKSFTPEMFKNMFNTASFKDMMDKMFNMQPDFMKNMMNMDMFKNNITNMMDSNKGMMDNMRANMMNMLPQGNDMFTHMLNNYNQMRNMMNESAAPMMKLMAPNASKASMDMMNDLSNEFAQYQIKNAQMQYMMYTTGMKAMEDVAEQVYTKMRNGEDMSSFLKIYQEWLNTNDKHFVSLFSTDEYSKMQAEVNTLGMKMKRHMDTQMEKMLNHIPVATRTEMDELYKTIYELKKRVNTLEKQIDSDEPIVAEEKEAKKGKSAKNA
jgi:uncharacterized membrane-anchored protein YhcB (DUF1043 family)